MPTGFEGYKLSELERLAYDTPNLLAQEVLKRCERDANREYKAELQAKRETRWAKEKK